MDVYGNGIVISPEMARTKGGEGLHRRHRQGLEGR